jgi:K+-transporting ATPase ATPase A chain
MVMNISGWLQLAFYIVVLVLITRPLGLFLFQVLASNGETFLDLVIKPLENLTYRIFGVNPEREQGWIHYTVSMLIFEVMTVLGTYLVLRFQNFLPLNPQGQAGVTDHLAFNTA